MVSRTGILSDEHFYKNCIDYSPMPVGYMNANVRRNMGNSEYSGIKASKYLLPVSRPVSMDVYAVSLAKYMKGNTAVNARTILNELHRQAKEFVPPTLSLEKMNRNIEDANNNVMARPMSYTGTSTGDIFTAQSMGSQSLSTNELTEYINIFKNSSNKHKEEMMLNFKMLVISEDVGIQSLDVALMFEREKLDKNISLNKKIKIIKSGYNILTNIGSKADLSKIFFKRDIDDSDTDEPESDELEEESYSDESKNPEPEYESESDSSYIPFKV